MQVMAWHGHDSQESGVRSQEHEANGNSVLVIAASLAKMPTTRERHFIFSFTEHTSRCDIHPLQQVGAPDLFPVRRREVTEGQTSSRASFMSSVALGKLSAS
jgi:hypothetical protein